MIHEFAVDPEIGSDWRDLRFVASHCGVEHGRMISQFPSKWKKQVYQHAPRTPLERKRIEEILSGMAKKLVKTGRTYDPESNWLPNAIRSHEESGFQGIVTLDGKPVSPSVVSVGDLSDDEPRWNPGRGMNVPRTPRDLAAAATNLIQWSSHIRFIDQHFSCARRHNLPLRQFIAASRGGPGVAKQLEYHLNANGSSAWFSEQLSTRVLPALKMAGSEIILFVRWEKIEFGENQHPRYILTDLGGLRFEVGLDCGDEGETTDVEAITQAIYDSRWEQFQADSSTFRFSDAWFVSSEGVTEAHHEGTGFR